MKKTLYYILLLISLLGLPITVLLDLPKTVIILTFSLCIILFGIVFMKLYNISKTFKVVVDFISNIIIHF